MPQRTSAQAQAVEVRVTDLAAAALLIANGCRLGGIEATDDPRRKAFLIRGAAFVIERLLSEYSRGEVTVELDAFLSAQRLLKERLFRGDRASL